MPYALILPLSTLLVLVLALVVDGVPALATTYHTRQAAETRQGASRPRGSDSYTCTQATHPATPKGSINGGLQCLAPGDTLMIGPGTYNELLISQQSSSRQCSSGDLAVEPLCVPMPNGVSPDRPTRLIGDGQAVLSPQGKQLPGGGSAITLLDYARHLHIEGLKVVRHSAPGSVGGIYSGNVQYVTLTRNELADGQIKGGVTSRYLTITHNYIHHTGLKECPQGDTKPTPAGCPHGMYVCGTDHVITDNRVEYCSYYGIQVSCEQGGIARIRLERNIVRHSAAVGIRCGGQDCLVASNLLEANGQGITLSGSGLVAHNTIHGYKAADWNDDPSAIWDTSGGSGSGWQIVNNLLTGQKNSFLLVGNNGGAAIDPGRVHHNMSEQVGNPGVTLIAPVSAIYRDAASGDLSLAATSPALGAGVALPAVPADLFGALYPTPPDLGAISGAGLPPDPGPDPGPEPTPPGAWVCRGDIQAVPGEIQLECQPKQEGRRWRTRDDLSR